MRQFKLLLETILYSIICRMYDKVVKIMKKHSFLFSGDNGEI